MSKEKVLIVGGGFAGTKTALELCEDERFEVTLLSDKEHLIYFPTLYHVATGGARANASIALKTIFEGKNVKLVTAKAKSLNRDTKILSTEDNKHFGYDSLILALGQVTNYFNIPGLAELSFGVKSISDVEKLKIHLHNQLTSDHKPDLNYVIVGAGATGTELAGSLQSYLLRIMEWHGIEKRPIHIDLVDSSPRVLPKIPKTASRRITKELKRLGIRIYLNKRVEGEDATELEVNNKPILSHTVIWTAGSANNPFYGENNFSFSANHKIATDVYLQAEEDIYVLGDNANTPYSGMAQTAIYDAKFIASNLKRKAANKKFKSYKPKAPITVIPVREGWAGIFWGNLHIYGWLAWFLRQAADIRAFHDFEPWSKALPQWFSYSSTEPVACTYCEKHKIN